MALAVFDHQRGSRFLIFDHQNGTQVKCRVPKKLNIKIRSCWQTMIFRIVIRRLLLQALMWSHLIVKIDPVFCFAQKVSQRPIRSAFGEGELNMPTKRSAEPLSVGVPARLIERSKPLVKRTARVCFAPYWLP